MKKILTSIALLGMLVAGCTNIDDIPDNSTPDNPAATPEVATDYMAVSIMNTGGAGSKADAVYENGTAVENKVSGIRFYFFDAEKEPAPVKKNPDKTAAAGEDVYDSYYDYTPAGNEFGGPGNNTIEKTITLTLTLNTNSSQLPVYVVAVLNPSEAALVEDNPSMEELNGIDADFLPGAVNKDEDISGNDSYVGKFVMSNSAYVKDGEAVNYTKITKLCKTAEEALDPDNQTVIYVERAVARLDLTIGKTDTEGKLKPAAEDGRYVGEDTENVFYTGNDYKLYNAAASEEAEPIYVKFIGWKVTSTPKKSNLLKQIDPQWPDNLFGEVGGTVKEPWNAANYFRSFWGMNPELAGAENKTQTGKTDYQFYSYNDINWAFGKDNKAATVYIQENAAKEGTNAVWENHESKVIVAAQLVNKKGEAMPIVEYGFSYYEKNALLQYFADQIWLYSSEDKAEGTKLSVNDLEYKTQYEYKGDAGVKVPGGYFSYVALSAAGKGKTWYLDGEKLEDEDAVNSYINDHLDSRLLIWEGGRTYYFFTIKHLGGGTEEKPGPGYYGVVRNHIYQADINKIAGLGTPVLKPGEVIYPEKPSRDGNILAAEIKILSWRVVSQDYEFSW